MQVSKSRLVIVVVDVVVVATAAVVVVVFQFVCRGLTGTLSLRPL